MSERRDMRLDGVRLWTDGEVYAWRDFPIPRAVLDAMARIVSMRASGGPVAEEDLALTEGWIKNQRRKYGNATPLSRGRD
jgi:hypothetical protein